MNPITQDEAIRRLGADFALKMHGKWLQDGKCPSCGKKELYASAEAPWVIKCGRSNNCAWESSLKDLYPDLFSTWSDRFKASDDNPHAAADAYLSEARGFDLHRLRGCYVQENFYHHDLRAGSATVRFFMADGYWERLIDKPERFDRKAHIKKGWSANGSWWCPPNIDLLKAEEIWLTEGIFDAIALWQNGVTAVATISSNYYPNHALQALAEQCRTQDRPRPLLVWAMDNDPAGHKAIEKWLARSTADGWESSAAQAPHRPDGKSQDWNDLHLKGRLGEKDIEKYRYYGRLLIARNATEKALLMYKHTERGEFAFDFGNRLYSFKLDLEAYTKKVNDLKIEDCDSDEERDEIRDEALTSTGIITEIANCRPTPLYYLANELTDESWYYFKIDFPNGQPPVKNTFTGAQLASASEFKKRLLSIAAGSFYTGSGQQLDRFLRFSMEGIKQVATVDFIGYSREHGAWIFDKLAVKDGKTIPLNKEDFFELGRLNIKSLNQSLKLAINPDPKELDLRFIDKIATCWGPKGIIALAFWLGSFFAEQIRDEQQSYPFLELVGAPGAGKSTLLELLWKLSGRTSYEGFDPAKSSLSGRSRNMAQVSNLPIVLMEGDRDDNSHAKKFDFDELKALYNGRSPRATGLKNSGNETYEPPFRGAVVIAQNATVNASDAVLERIIHINLPKASRENRDTATALSRTDVSTVSGFIIRAIAQEKKALDIFKNSFPVHEARLGQHPDIKSVRICLNHGQIMALVDVLDALFPLRSGLKESVMDEVVALAVQRQQRINEDHPIVQKFWEVFEYVNVPRSYSAHTLGELLNHSSAPGLIAVNLNHFEECANEARQQIPDMTELKRQLHTSRRYRFVESNRTVTSAIRKDGSTPRSVKCWIFEKP